MRLTNLSRRCTVLSAVSLAILFSLASCATQEAGHHDGSAAQQENAQNSESPELRLGNDILGSIRDGDYAGFARTLAGKTGFDISRQDFDSSCAGVEEKYGRPVSWSHLTSLDDPIAVQNIWKVRFVKPRAEGSPVERDMLFRLVCAQIDGKNSVLAFGFF